MTLKEQQEILRLLDRERQTVVYPGMSRFSDAGVVRDLSADGKSCEIVYSSCAESEIDQVIEHQIRAARSARYELEWKVYGHDRPACLGERLAAAGFEASAQEEFMVFFASQEALDCFGTCSSDIRRVTGSEALRDYQTIMEEIRGRSCAKEIKQYAFMLEKYPNNMSLYVAYVGGEPAACGRIYLHERSRFAALYGGSTRERFRKRGLFTQMVAVRIQEALSRGIVNVCVDALPTSEPILRKHGFERVTHTQPFCFSASR